MAKSSTIFVCQNCGYEAAKWAGQCPNCGQWNSLVEEQRIAESGKRISKGRESKSGEVVRFSAVQQFDQHVQRLSTGMDEFDRVLGGGIVYGSVVLIGGEPGIGKSTLLTHLSLNILKYTSAHVGLNVEDKRTPSEPARVLYVAGEESPEQISLRIQRMGTESSKLKRKDQNGDSTLFSWQENLFFLTSTDVDEIVATIENEHPSIVIIDSIQTLSTQDLTGATGSIGQLKESTERLTRCAKKVHIPIFLVGHVTKEGAIAGPKVLEHMVDCVLELSGERTGQFRTLRAIKNRFGATDEVGIFQHTDAGLIEVSNPSELLLEERQAGAIGSAIVSVMEGTRPLLIEVQALVVRSQLAMPRRVTRGIPVAKLQVLCAVLEKYANLPLSNCDVFVNVAGGLTITEPAADLGIAMACASSYKNQTLPEKHVYVGEVGLLGEVRRVQYGEKRAKESQRLGFSTVIDATSVTTLKQAMLAVFKK